MKWTDSREPDCVGTRSGGGRYTGKEWFSNAFAMRPSGGSVATTHAATTNAWKTALNEALEYRSARLVSEFRHERVMTVPPQTQPLPVPHPHPPPENRRSRSRQRVALPEDLHMVPFVTGDDVQQCPHADFGAVGHTTPREHGLVQPAHERDRRAAHRLQLRREIGQRPFGEVPARNP